MNLLESIEQKQTSSKIIVQSHLIIQYLSQLFLALRLSNLAHQFSNSESLENQYLSQIDSLLTQGRLISILDSNSWL
jgi:hypothetical protein